MNWPSYFEDINDRATASPPTSGRKVGYQTLCSAQEVDLGATRQSRAKPRIDPEVERLLTKEKERITEQRIAKLKARERRQEAEARRLKEDREAALARMQRSETDLLDWGRATSDVEPLDGNAHVGSGWKRNVSR